MKTTFKFPILLLIAIHFFAILVFSQSQPLSLREQQRICMQLGQSGQCASASFCKETVFPRGCYRLPGKDESFDRLCKREKLESGCNLMAATGVCAWNSETRVYCDAK